jgi:hypothetical protein
MPPVPSQEEAIQEFQRIPHEASLAEAIDQVEQGGLNRGAEIVVRRTLGTANLLLYVNGVAQASPVLVADIALAHVD